MTMVAEVAFFASKWFYSSNDNSSDNDTHFDDSTDNIKP